MLRPTWCQDGNTESLPSSSPPRSQSQDGDEVVSDVHRVRGSGHSVASGDSAPLWAALDSPPRTAPALAQFDEHEFTSYEDGELANEEASPKANQVATQSRLDEEARERADRLDKYMGEYGRVSYRDDEPTARKRSWTGTAVSEENRRSARRPRIVSQDRPPPPVLPPIRELIGNPWIGMGDGKERNSSLQSPVPVSTPKHPAFVRDLNSFQYDMFANVSGHPPTLRGSSIDTSVITSAGDAKRPSVSSRASVRSETSGMVVDDEPAHFRSSLLERPSGRRRFPGVVRDTSENVGPWNLRDALEENESCRPGSMERDQENFWRGGYRPRNWDTERARPTSRTGEEENRPWMAGDGGVDPAGRFSCFSALPNTKAWDYRRDAARQAEFGDHSFPATPASRTSTFNDAGADEDLGAGVSERGGDSSYARRAGRSHAVLSGSEEDEDGAAPGKGGVVGPEWWQEARTTRLPTALMKEKDVEDVPRVVDNPHSDRWTIHLSDPEEKYAGMSMEWMKTIWMDGCPTVFFTVFNYRFTKNQEINRHIEANVTAMTTHLTGESGFHVVPPDPEWRHELRARDLPYLWVIRGLSEAAAWEMVKLRVISARGVSIITHPKAIENPKFVCGLAGFLRPDVKTTKAAVLSVLESEYMLKRLADLVRTCDRLGHLSIVKRVERVIESLDIRFMATKEDGYVANVYILPPSDDLDEWRGWAEEMRACRFNVFLNGTGSARKAFWCGGCRGLTTRIRSAPSPR
ncbi:hypothetical protein C8T65DRAFT_736986 [Cerioporus squamosus]|nr:hypothetical protein C8T65DRAFT_736986 [Cerioporus squamosus]